MSDEERAIEPVNDAAANIRPRGGDSSISCGKLIERNENNESHTQEFF